MMLSSILLSGLAAFSLAEARVYKRPTDAVGAVYCVYIYNFLSESRSTSWFTVISNEPSGNQVVASHVYSNGAEILLPTSESKKANSGLHVQL